MLEIVTASAGIAAALNHVSRREGLPSSAPRSLFSEAQEGIILNIFASLFIQSDRATNVLRTRLKNTKQPRTSSQVIGAHKIHKSERTLFPVGEAMHTTPRGCSRCAPGSTWGHVDMYVRRNH